MKLRSQRGRSAQRRREIPIGGDGRKLKPGEIGEQVETARTAARGKPSAQVKAEQRRNARRSLASELQAFATARERRDGPMSLTRRARVIRTLAQRAGVTYDEAALSRLCRHHDCERQPAHTT